MKPVKISKKDIEEKFKEKEMMSTLPKKFRDKRLSLGLGKYELAELAEVSPWFIIELENGWVIPEKEIIDKISKVLDNY